MFFTFSLAVFLWFGSRQNIPILETFAYAIAFNVALFVSLGYAKELWKMAAPVTNGFVRNLVRVFIVFVSIFIFIIGCSVTSLFLGYSLDRGSSKSTVDK